MASVRATETVMPKGITRGYATQFLDALNRVPGHKDLVLTRQQLDAMDENPVLTVQIPVKLGDEEA